MSRPRRRPGLALVALALSIATPGLTQQAPDPATIPAAGLLNDFEIFRRAYLELHPGLYRYTTPEELEARFDTLRLALSRDLTRAEAYLGFSRFLAAIRCGHTYANFWNQSEEIQAELFGGRDKLPFTFRLIGDRMIVTADASDAGALPPGTEVASIDGEEVGAVLARLMPYVAADGSNDGKRRDELQLTGVGDYEYFDVFFPLLHPVRAGAFSLEIESPAGERGEVRVDAVTRQERSARLAERYGPRPDTVDELWRFEVWDSTTAYLKVGSFVTWRMEMDWREFLRDAFQTMRERDIRFLVLDLRGNAGGDAAVGTMLQNFLLSKEIRIRPRRQLLRYRSVPSDLAPYLETWEDGFFDRGESIVPVEDGFYTFRSARLETRTVPARDDAFQGRAFVLVGPANSSGTFTLAATLKAHRLATLVGRTTGGNLRGINSGQFFFLRLPSSGLETDIPLIAYVTQGQARDAGVEPDVLVEPAVEDVRAGIDPEIEAVRRLIAEAKRPAPEE